jgi:hypothetical protein
MAATSCENFYALLERSGLLTIDELKAVQESTAELADPKAVARQLVADQHLTRWQAAQLLAGGAKLSMGKYRLLDQLGSSPTGKVYLATNPQLNRKVAIKAINRRKTHDSDQLQRFQQEARAVARLDHRNIVHAYDVDREGNLDMIVMEHVDGRDLQQMVASAGPLPAWHAANYAYQTALGLAHAHERGVTHGDLKPSNLLVDSHGVLKIGDMGVARISQENGDDIASRTAISFLSPEQVRGARGEDAASDLYSLGSTLYFLLAGKPPFAETNDLRVLLKQQVDGPPPLAKIRSDAPPGLVAICERLMATNPKQRYASAGEAAAELKGWLDTHSKSDMAQTEAMSEFVIEAEPPRWSAGGSHKNLPVTGATAHEKAAAAPEPMEADEKGDAGGGVSRGVWIGLGGVAVLVAAIAAFFALRPGDEDAPDDDTTAEAIKEDDDARSKAEQEAGKGESGKRDASKSSKKSTDKEQAVAANELVWVDDDTPADAIGTGTENFASWQWVAGEQHQVHSGKAAVLRKSPQLSEHRFEEAKKHPLVIKKGDKLFAYVWLDPKDTPEMMMIEWNDGAGEHRAFWGADKANVGKLKTPSRLSMGPLPATGKWARLEVPAAEVGLAAGAKVTGMAFIQFGGTAYWDTVGLAHSDGSEKSEKLKPKPDDVANKNPKPKPKPKPKAKPEPEPRAKGEEEPPKDASLAVAQSHPVQIVKATADKDVKLVEQPDGSLRASGPNAADVTYEVVVKTALPRITGFKLECLSDEPLPAKGPGRHKNGAFIVTEIKAFVADNADMQQQQPVTLNDVVADHEADKWPAKAVIDDNRNTGWSTVDKPGESHWLAAAFKSPLNDAAAGGASKDLWLKFEIKHFPKDDFSLGCFRLRALTGREASDELAALPQFPPPPNPFAELPKRMSLPPLEEAGASNPLEIGPVEIRDLALADCQLLGGDGAAAGSEIFSLSEDQGGDDLAWQVQLGEEGRGAALAQIEIRAGKLWFHWLPAAKEEKLAENLGNCLLLLSYENAEHRITLRQPVEVDPISLSLADPKKMMSSFKFSAAPKSELVRWELVGLDKSLPDSRVKPDAPYTLKQRVQIGLGAAGSEDVVVQITPSSSKLQVVPYFRVADGQKPVRLSAAALKRMSGQIALNKQLLTKQKAQIEARPDGDLKKRLLEQINKDLPALDAMAARLTGVVTQAEALEAAEPVGFRIYYEIDAETKVVLVKAKAGDGSE